MGQITAEVFRMNNESFSMTKIMEETVGMFEEHSQIDNIKMVVQEISSENDTTKSDQLIGDAHRLQQILINLIKNALKFTKVGSIEIKYWFDRFNSLLNVEIKDTGIGIRPEDIKKLFKTYGRLENMDKET